jgi:hypothetical protein
MSTKLKVTFIDIDVAKDGDPVGKGDLYWNFKVDGALVANREAGNPYNVGSGGLITLGTSKEVTKSDGSTLVISGAIKEKDDWDKDEGQSFSHSWKAPDWGMGLPQPVRIVDKNLDVTMHYIVERVAT